MTKEKYFEMCEMLNQSPVEEDIPVEYEDLYDEVQEAILVYNMLSDNIDTMNGVYLGKVLTGITDVLDIVNVQDKASCFNIIRIIDNERANILNVRQKNKPAKKT